MTWLRRIPPPANTARMNQALIRLEIAVNRLKELTPK